MSEANSQSLAERCFAEGRATDELFETIHRIMGGEPLAPGISYPCSDCWCDPYDSSVELVTNQPLTREQANQIIDLGFGQIYESHNGEGINWTRASQSKCSPREVDQSAQIKAERDTFRAENKRLREEVERLKEMEATWDRGAKEHAKVRASLAASQERVQALEKDKVRLDWLSENPFAIRFANANHGAMGGWTRSEAKCADDFPDIRQAIDAATAATQEGTR